MSVDDACSIGCAWCGDPLPPTCLLRGGRFCGKACRQAAFRLRRQSETEAATARPLRLGYADPPYPGLAKRFYGSEPSYAGEVDHVALIERLTSGEFDGWALSTSERALRDLLPLCPREARLMPWVKPHGVSRATRGPHNAWEAVIVMPARLRRNSGRDWLRAMPARGGGTLMGRKPLAFCAALFRWLGMVPGDELVDLFPGTGAVSRAWDLLSREGHERAASLAARNDASPPADDDAPPRGAGDTSREVLGDTSPMVEAAGNGPARLPPCPVAPAGARTAAAPPTVGP